MKFGRKRDLIIFELIQTIYTIQFIVIQYTVQVIVEINTCTQTKHATTYHMVTYGTYTQLTITNHSKIHIIDLQKD